MDSKYHRLPPLKEEYHRSGSIDSSSTLGGLENVDVELKSSSLEKEGRWHHFTATSKWMWLLHVLLLLSSFTFFTLGLALRSSPSTLSHVRQFSAWSPADTSVRYAQTEYNVTTKDNRFVGARPDVDKAWREISYDVGDQWISQTDIQKLGMPETSLRVDNPQTGETGFRVGIEVFHQLHCVNLLRRVTYKDYYEPLGGEFAAGPEALQKHTDHCLEILRLNLQCNADIGLFTFYMVEGDPLAWPQLNSKHVCRDFGRVRQWALDHSVGNMEVLS